MKKAIIFTLLVLSFQPVKSQHWLQPGATYDYYYQVQSAYRIEQIKFIKDTVFQGRTCCYLKKATEYFNSMSYADLFVNKTNDSVFIASSGSWRFLFNLNPNIGDLWNYGASSNTVVDSIKIDTINNMPYKNIYVHPVSGSTYGYRNNISERFGPATRYIDWQGLSLNGPVGVSPWLYYLTCYYDSTYSCCVSMYPYSSQGTCENPFFNVTGVNDVDVSSSFVIMPNPVSNYLIVKFKAEHPGTSCVLRLYNITGQLVKQQSYNYTSSSVVLSMEGVDQGLYVLEIETPHTKEWMKLVKD